MPQAFTNMSEFSPSIPIQLQIRKVIFENFNDVDLKFNNDQIFEIIQKNNDIDKSWTIDDMEKHFKEICDRGLVRSIAQNLSTQWFKLFELVEKIHCNSCNNDIFLGKSEDRVCPNPSCKSTI